MNAPTDPDLVAAAVAVCEALPRAADEPEREVLCLTPEIATAILTIHGRDYAVSLYPVPKQRPRRVLQ